MAYSILDFLRSSNHRKVLMTSDSSSQVAETQVAVWWAQEEPGDSWGLPGAWEDEGSRPSAISASCPPQLPPWTPGPLTLLPPNLLETAPFKHSSGGLSGPGQEAGLAMLGGRADPPRPSCCFHPPVAYTQRARWMARCRMEDAVE
jgi:hypothetical protein